MITIKEFNEVKRVSAVFLDRDGVINQDFGYVGNWNDFDFCPGALDALKFLSDKGVDIIIITNQSGIARGYYTEEQYNALTKKMLHVMQKHGVTISSVYYCPHYIRGDVLKYAVDCDCRKPKPGMILKGLETFSIKANMIFDNMNEEYVDRLKKLCQRYETEISDFYKSNLITNYPRGQFKGLSVEVFSKFSPASKYQRGKRNSNK